MPAFLGIALQWAGSIFGNLLSALKSWFSLLAAFMLGVKATEKEAAEDALDAKNRQLEAATRRPRGRRGLIERLRSGRF